MVKTQNTRKRSLGVRSLSVVLTILLVLSTCAVMFSVSWISASAYIKNWYVAGSFNNWSYNANHNFNGSSGSVTIDLSAYRGHNIQFKMVAYNEGNANSGDNGDKWCSYGKAQLSRNTGYKMGWGNAQGNGNEMSYQVQSGLVKFEIYQIGLDNYVKITEADKPTPSSTDGEIHSDRPTTYNDVPVNSDGGGKSDQDVNIFWANATYFDYLSDEELYTSQWLKPLQAGTGFDGALDEWYPFYNFNRSVVKNNAGTWGTPLYFGNFCNTGNNGGPSAYATSSHHMYLADNRSGYADATNSDNVVNFNYHANNSNGLTFRYYDSDNQTEVYKYQESYQGLMAKKLSNGRLMTSGNTVAPYFDATMLGKYAKVINSSFPFTVTDKTDTAGKSYKFYEFDSKNAKDNVYFTWATDGNKTYPTAVNYGGGTTYGVKDGYKKFMGKAKSGDEAQYGEYGIFPFNNASSKYKGNKSNANENLNYGFGIRVDMKFRLPSAGDAKFEFSGDDDLWAYITDENGNSMQVLDMGGSHKMSTGYVDFRNTKSHVDYVYSNTSFDKTFAQMDSSFNFDPSATYTLTVFYMERGLIESNAHMTFTMAPAGNQVKVDKTVDTEGINSEKLQTAVKAADSFNFTAYEATSENGTYSALKNKDYYDQDGNVKQTNSQSGNFVLKNAQSAAFLSQYTTGNYAYVAEGSTSGTNLSYSTRWTINDPINNTTTNGTGLSTVNNKKKLQKTSGTIYDYAELDYSFVNTPDKGTVAVTKVVDQGTAQEKAQEFDAKVEVSLDGGNTYDVYPLTYTVSGDKTGTYPLNEQTGHLNSNGLLKEGRTLTFGGLPTKAKVRISEQFDAQTALLYEFDSAAGTTVVQDASIKGGVITVPASNANTNTMTITNKPIPPDEIDGTITGTKYLDNDLYKSGAYFSYELEGVAKFNDDDNNVKDTSSLGPNNNGQGYTITTTDANGKFTFSGANYGLHYTEPGIYRYVVTEAINTGTSFHNGKDFEQEINSDATSGVIKYEKFLVVITVSENATTNKLEATTASRGYFTQYDDMIAGDDPGYVEPTPKPLTKDDFVITSDNAADIVFYNRQTPGSVTVTKTDQEDQPVQGVTFALYQIDASIESDLDDMTSDEARYNYIKTKLTPFKTAVSTDNGIAYFGNLPIFETNSETGKYMYGTYQNYRIIEYSVPEGYNLSKYVPLYENTLEFKFPQKGSDNNWIYDLEFGYVNGKMVNPLTGYVSPIGIFRTVGFGIIGVALVFGVIYLLRRKKVFVRYKKKH